MVDLPLWKNMSSSVGMIIPNWMEQINMFQATNQIIINMVDDDW